MNLRRFELPHGKHVLQGDTYEMCCETMVLHGAGKSSRARFARIRESLNAHGIPSASFDFIGHGETGGELTGSTLHERTEQAAAVIGHACEEPLTLIAASMSAYTAIRLTQIFAVKNLILLVPAVYASHAYDLAFGSEFSAAIRVRDSWKDSDAFCILEEFKGRLLVMAAQDDNVIPAGVVQGIRASAKNAKTNDLHVVPGSAHLSLFPGVQDFLLARDMIIEVCQGEN